MSINLTSTLNSLVQNLARSFSSVFSFWTCAVALVFVYSPSIAQANIDMAVTAITSPSPTTPAQHNSPVDVTFEVTNVGSTDFFRSSIVVYVAVDGIEQTKQVSCSGSFTAGVVRQCTAFVGANIWEAGTHTVKVTFVPPINGDANSSNNSLQVNVTTLQQSQSAVEVTAFPYLQDFESGAANWTASQNGTTLFKLETPTPETANYITGADSGTMAWKTGRSAGAPRDIESYDNDAQAQVISPIFDLRSHQFARVDLAVWWESAPRVSGAQLQKSTDDGLTWTTIGTNGEPANWYNNSTNSGLAPFQGGESSWSGYTTAGSLDSTPDPYDNAGAMTYTTSGTVGSDAWLDASHVFIAGAKTRLRVIFGAKSGADEGFAFDTVGVSTGGSVTLNDTLVIDNDSDGRADPGDTVEFSAFITNTTGLVIPGSFYSDLFSDSNLSLVAGSVTTSSGSIVSGNTSGNTTVGVDLGSLGASQTVVITYRGLVGALSATTTEICSQGLYTATPFVSERVFTDDQGDTTSAFDPNCFAASIDLDGDGLADGVDSDNDGLTDAEELALGSDPFSADSDGDGLDDEVELLQGLDLTESNNGDEPLTGEICSEWNGFLDQLVQILEQRNTSTTQNITVSTKLYDINGALQDTITSVLQPGQQRDLIVNAMNGFAAGTYGNVCSTITSGPTGVLAGQYVSYKFTATSYELAFADQFIESRTGEQHLSYNTYQPSLAPGDTSDFVAGWVQLSNDETTTESGELRFYNSEGILVRTDTVSISGRSRRDFDIHSLGVGQIGLISWVPTNGSAKFRLREKRYYFDGALSATPGLIAANSTAGSLGSGSSLSIPVQTAGKTAAVELSNTLSSAVSVIVRLNNSDGTNVASQNVTIPAKGTRHAVFSDLLTTAEGLLTVDADTASSVIANVFYYGREAGGELAYTDTIQPSNGAGFSLNGSYNSFLNQSCSLLVGNQDAVDQDAVLNVTRYDGGRIFEDLTITVPAGGVVAIDICSNERQEAYGSVALIANDPGVLVGLVTRENAEGTVQFSTPLRRGEDVA